MSESSEPQAEKDFEDRLARARERERPPEERSAHALPQSGLGLASRIGTELVVTLVMGIAIGYGIDRWLDTRPWFLIGFTLLGGAAGLWNVFRLAMGQGSPVGFKRPTKSDEHKG